MRDELRVEERPAYEILCEAYIEIRRGWQEVDLWTSFVNCRQESIQSRED